MSQSPTSSLETLPAPAKPVAAGSKKRKREEELSAEEIAKNELTAKVLAAEQSAFDAWEAKQADRVACTQQVERWRNAYDFGRTLKPLDPIETAEFLTNKWAELLAKNTSNAVKKVNQPPDPHKGKVKTFAMSVELYTTRGYMEIKQYKSFEPLPENDPLQMWRISHKTPSYRKLTVSDGKTTKQSPTHNKMQTDSISADQRLINKEKSARKKSEALMGQDRKNASEGVSIELLTIFLRKNIPDFDDLYEFLPVFDGLQADIILRVKSTGKLYAIQIKSVNIQFGKASTYNIKTGEYDPRIYCIGIGMRNYVHNNNPTDPNDNSPGTAEIFEIWNIGDCKNIETSLGPTPGLFYSKLDASRRLYVKHARDGVESQAHIQKFAQDMIDKILTFEALSLDTIYFDMDFNGYDTNNPDHRNNITENMGIHALYNIFKNYSINLKAPFRQGEATDACAVHKDTIRNWSLKTATVSGGENRRQFDLHTAPNHHFCTDVIASYMNKDNTSPTTFAVIPPDIAYADLGTCERPYFYWNHSHLGAVKLFDTSTPAGELAFVRHFFPDAQKV